jgi:hypothetical protein
MQYALWYEASGNRWRKQQTSALPGQTGMAGSYLTTDGTSASWAPWPSMSSFSTVAPETSAVGFAISSVPGRIVARRVFIPGTITVNAFNVNMIVAGAASCRTGVAVYKLNESLNGTLIAGAASQEACDGPAGLKTLAPVSGTLAPGEYYVAMASTSAGATYAGIGANGASQTAHLGGTVAPLTVQSAGGVFNGTTWPSSVSFTAVASATSTHVVVLRK